MGAAEGSAFAGPVPPSGAVIAPNPMTVLAPAAEPRGAAGAADALLPTGRTAGVAVNVIAAAAADGRRAAPHSAQNLAASGIG
jgi:hypothetical protein